MAYDILLKGGHVIDPKNGVDAKANIAIKDGPVRGGKIPATSKIIN
jgi:predicted amidohydrolase